MLTVVLYVVVTLVVATALYFLSVVVFGRAELLPPIAKGHTVTYLPEGPLTGADVRTLQLGMAPRGYTMREVDWTLEQLAAEIDRLRALAGEDDVRSVESASRSGTSATASRGDETR